MPTDHLVFTDFFVLSNVGNIPESFRNLVNLQLLDLSENKLEGQFFYFSGWSVPTDHQNLTDFSLVPGSLFIKDT